MESTRITGHQILTWQQVQGLLANEETLLSGGAAIREKAYTVDTTWAAAEEYYHAHSTADRALIRKTGQQNQIGWWDPATQTHTDNPTHARGILVCQMYLNQDCKCAYTGTGPYSILDFQVEHIEPNGGDHPDNMLLVVYNVNENRKQSTMEGFIARWRKRASKGMEEYNTWYDDTMKASAKGQKEKVKILSMDEEELKTFAPICAKKYHKYMWRNIGMSSLQPFRLTKKGVARAGGSQGNYKEVLNTVLQEYLYGDKNLAAQIFHTVRSGADRYVRGFINNTDYVEMMCAAIELSNHVAVEYNREKFTTKVLRNTYSWPHLSK